MDYWMGYQCSHILIQLKPRGEKFPSFIKGGWGELQYTVPRVCCSILRVTHPWFQGDRGIEWGKGSLCIYEVEVCRASVLVTLLSSASMVSIGIGTVDHGWTFGQPLNQRACHHVVIWTGTQCSWPWGCSQSMLVPLTRHQICGHLLAFISHLCHSCTFGIILEVPCSISYTDHGWVMASAQCNQMEKAPGCFGLVYKFLYGASLQTSL